MTSLTNVTSTSIGQFADVLDPEIDAKFKATVKNSTDSDKIKTFNVDFTVSDKQIENAVFLLKGQGKPLTVENLAAAIAEDVLNGIDWANTGLQDRRDVMVKESLAALTEALKTEISPYFDVALGKLKTETPSTGTTGGSSSSSHSTGGTGSSSGSTGSTGSTSSSGSSSGSSGLSSIAQQAMASGDFATAIMAIQEERVSLLNEVIQQNIMSMDANNQKIKDARDRLIAKRNELKNTPDNTDNKDKREDLELDIANIQAEIDNLSTNSQSDTIKLQGLINKQNQALEMWTNLVQKMSDVMNKIVGNFR